mgnify:FL=1
MNKDDILLVLEQIEQKYSLVPENQRQFGSKLSPEQSENYNSETHPGIYPEIQMRVLNSIKNNPILMNDLDIGMKIVKLAPYAFGYIGEEARRNVAIFMEACKGNIRGSFRTAGDNILENEDFMMMVMKINPSLFTYMNDDMKSRPSILQTYVEEFGYIPAEVGDSITPELREKLKPYITYKIEGMREETFMKQVCEERDFEYDIIELPRQVICCSRGDKKFEIDLYSTYGECPSGHTTASWGNMDIHKVEEFGKMTHLPKEPMTFELQMEEDGFYCPAFSVTYIGGDDFYPNGDAAANLELFLKKDQQVKAIKEPFENAEEKISSDGDLNKKHVQIEKEFKKFIIQTKDSMKRPVLVMSDGTKMSVQASAFHYCEPRKNGLKDYESFEVNYLNTIIEQLRDYTGCQVESDEELLQSIYSFVPKAVILDILEEHGGIDLENTLHPTKKLDGLQQERDGMDAKVKKAQDLINQMMEQYEMFFDQDEPDIK